MKTRTCLFVVLLLASIRPVRSELVHADAIRDVLERRAERPADPVPAPRPTHLLGGAPNRLLFSMDGPDNASCVRAVPDVTGDGLDEIVVGIDESGTDNIFCLDGASRGTATAVWQIETMDGVSGGSPWGDQSVVPSSDSDGNGYGNVLVGTAWGGRTAYNLDTLDGSVIWKFDTYDESDSGWVYSLAELGDLNGDDVPEVAFGVGSMNDRLYAVDGDSGPNQATPVWRWLAGDAVYSVRNLGDVNGDGYHDVLAAVGDDVDTVVALDGGTESPNGSVLWTYEPGATVIAVGVLPDITDDGIDEALAVLWTSGGSAIRCLNGATGLLEWASTEVPDFGQMVDILADVDGDEKDDVIVSSWENAVIVLSGADGSRIWKTSVGTTNGGDVWTARAIDDLNEDGRQDVIAGSFDTFVYAFDGDDGELLWSHGTGNRVFSVASVGDLTGDGAPEVAVGTQDTTSSTVVLVLEGGVGPIFADGFEDGDVLQW